MQQRARFFCCRPVWALPPPPISRHIEGRQRNIQLQHRWRATQREEGVRGDRESVSAPCQTTEYTGKATFWRTFHYDGKISPDCPPTLFHYIYHTYKVEEYAPAERADTLPPFLLYPYVYSVRRWCWTRIIRQQKSVGLLF